MIVFRNKGVIDVTSITTFGVSSKEKAGAIGFFGTGLKYAIAILLREGCSITIHAGKQTLEFGTERATVRVNDFTFVTMNGERLGFTTELGKTWEPWAAFRELYCNAMDEDGEAFELLPNEVLSAPDGDTTIVVRGELFRDVWARRSEIILQSMPLERHEACHIHPGPSEYVFYRGVRAYKLGVPTRYTYDIQRKVELTEDRTVKYMWDVNNAINRAVLESRDGGLVRSILTAPKGTYEYQNDFCGCVPSAEVLDVVRHLARTHDMSLNRTVLETCRPWLMDSLDDATSSALSALEQQRLDRAIKFCESIGFPVTEYPIMVSDFLGQDVLGRALDSRIYVSKRVFMMGTKMLAGTLIEEFLHLRHRVTDETRLMQNFLMDTIVSLGEQITGEPL